LDASYESPNLDFLRSVAVLSVLAAHFKLLLEARKYPHIHWMAHLSGIGRWGVLMFFVHTSLVLMFSLERLRQQRSDQRLFLTFFIRRVLRIYPLSIFVVSLVAICRLPVTHLVEGRFIRLDVHPFGVLANLFLVQDLWKIDSVIAPLWSLCYEMHMYLLLPALFLFVRVTRRTWPLLLLWAVVAAIAGKFGIMGQPGVREFLMFAPCFLSGIVAYRLTMTRKLRLPSWLWPLAVLLCTAVYLHWESDTAVWYYCLFLGAAIPQFRELRNAAVRRTCQIIARYSYGIYLLHFICMWVAFQAIESVPVAVQWVVFLVTICAFPVLTYHVIEKPMMRADRKILAVLRGRRQPDAVIAA
jgi:peptidoglycan/LPS O-acetylase OafA/YrhL